jgi:SAM-dependent methyltransferase
MDSFVMYLGAKQAFNLIHIGDKMVRKAVVTYDATQHTEVVQTLAAEGDDLKLYNIFRHIDADITRGDGFWRLHEDERIADLGCGAGDISRLLVDHGAGFVLGIDSKKEMIDIAKGSNKGYHGKAIFIQADVSDIKGDESFDLAIASYLYNNARSMQQLMDQAMTTASFLRPGGRFIAFNNNPFDLIGGDFTKYGFRKKVTGTREGARIIYDYGPIITDRIINYYLSPAAHQAVFLASGFTDFRFEPVILRHVADKAYWKEYFDREHLPVIGIVATKK